MKLGKKVTYGSHTHRRHGHSLVLAAQLGQCCDHLASAGSTEGVTKSTVDISKRPMKARIENIHGTTTWVHF